MNFASTKASHKRTWECGRNKPCPFCGDTISREEQKHPVKTWGEGGRGAKLPIGIGIIRGEGGERG